MSEAYTLPSGWAEASIAEIADSRLGKMLDRQKHKTGAELPYLGNINVRWDYIETTSLQSMFFESHELERYGLRSGDVLVCEGGEPGRAAIWSAQQKPVLYQKALHRVRLKGGILPEWLVKSLRLDSSSGALAKYFTGTTIKHLVGEALARYQLRLPPLAEQKRIVAKIEALQSRSKAAREALQEIPSLIEKFRQSVLAAAFRGDLTKEWREKNKDKIEPASELLKRIRVERRKKWEEAELEKMRKKGKLPTDDKWKAKYKEPEPVDTEGLPELPEGWCWASLDELILRIDAGKSRQTLERPALPGEVALLKLSAVTWGEFNPSENKALVKGDAFEPKHGLHKSDLLITRANTPELVGAVVIVREEHPSLLLSDKTLRLVPIDDLEPDFLLFALRTRDVRSVYETNATGTSNSMRNLSQEKILSAPIPLPPKAERLILIDILTQSSSCVSSFEAKHHESGSLISSLDQSILAKAFRGELVPQDPNDEPASVLLERIRKEREEQGMNGNAKGVKAAKRGKKAKEVA